jgi:FkbM family methyltransferase
MSGFNSSPVTLFHMSWLNHYVSKGLAEARRHNDDAAIAAERTFFSRLIIYLLETQAAGEMRDREQFDFYSFCQRHLERSHSQILQDLWVLFMLKEKEAGYFVEFGACDGKLMSNTLLLERDYGWTGILAEPNQIWHSALEEHRHCIISHECVFSRTGDLIAFSATREMPELSRLTDVVPKDVHEAAGNRKGADIISVRTISLRDLLDAHGAPKEIDYLSIDTEGSEWDILSAFDFGSYRFNLISVEHAGDTEKRNAIKRLLEENGYRRWRPELSRRDDWYTRT